MKAYIIDPAAPSGVRLTDAPDPQPKPNEAVIAVEAFSLNHGELPRGGMFPEKTIPGWDAAGTILTAAADGSGPKAGARVVSFGANGAWAERRSAATANIAELPAGLDAERASALPVAGVTALRALRTLGAILGRRVLVTGATGGVGRFAVQLAHRAGAHVVALTSSDAKRQELTGIGADEVVTELSQLTGPLYGVIDNVGGQTLVDAWGHLVVGGLLISIGYAGGTPAVFPPYDTVGPRRTIVSFTVTHEMLQSETLGTDLGFVARLVAAGELDPQVVWRGPWSKLPEAIELLETRKISGKAVLTV